MKNLLKFCCEVVEIGYARAYTQTDIGPYSSQYLAPLQTNDDNGETITSRTIEVIKSIRSGLPQISAGDRGAFEPMIRYATNAQVWLTKMRYRPTVVTARPAPTAACESAISANAVVHQPIVMQVTYD